MGITQNTGASSLIKPGVIDNTAARPASPFEGQVIFQKDTDELLAYNGTAWTRPANMPWGYVDGAGGTATTAISAGGSGLLVLSKAITIYANRRYKISGQLGFQPSANSTGNYVYFSATGLISKVLWYRGDQIAANYPQYVGGMYLTTASALGVTSGSGSVTFNLYVRIGGGGNLNTFPDGQVSAGSAEQLLWLEDIGPA